MKIVFASSNVGKIRELQSLLQPLAITLIPQSDLQIQDVRETGQTFIENALIKARHAATMTKLPTIADDSGLVVPALNGAPGIYSARYAGIDASATQNIAKLLSELKNVREQDRQAYFYCILVMLKTADDPCPIICEGKWHGKILTKIQGDGGFGYDPVFYVPEKNCSAAQLTLAEKNQLSHRGIALRCLMASLNKSN